MITLSTVAAMMYAILAFAVVVFQCVLLFGAPWGHLTMGGYWPGALPGKVRILCVVQAILILCAAVAVLNAAGLSRWLKLPDWAYTATLVMAALSCVANAISRSKPERMLWTPIVIVMLILAVLAGYANA